MSLTNSLLGVISQDIDRKRRKLFRLHAFSDGSDSRFMKFVVKNIKPGVSANGYTEFDIVVYDSSIVDEHKGIAPESAPLHTFEQLDLDPSSENFICKKIGDRHVYYMFDTAAADRKIVFDGQYPLQTQLVRVEVDRAVWDNTMPKEAIPVGFSGIHHLVTAATTPAGGGSILTGSFSDHDVSEKQEGSETVGDLTDVIKSVVQPPLPFVGRLSRGVPGSSALEVIPGVTWGAQYTRPGPSNNPNTRTEISQTVSSLTTFFPSFHTVLQNPWVGDNTSAPDVGGCIFDADRFNNNMFTLENVVVITGDVAHGTELPDPNEWPSAIYSRTRTLPPALYRSVEVGAIATNSERQGNVRFVDPTRDLADPTSRAYLYFTVPFQGGFNGLDIFNAGAQKMSDLQVFRERNDPNIGSKNGPVTTAFAKAIDIITDRTNADIALLSIPGIKHRAVTDKIVEACDEHFGAMAVLDIEEFDEYNTYITSSIQESNVKNTSQAFAARALGTSFAAAYYPDVDMDFNFTGPNMAGSTLMVPAFLK